MKIFAFDNKILALNNKWLRENSYVPPVDPYNPLGLPALTIRVKVASGSSAPSPTNATVTAVQGQTDVYDICTANSARPNDWSGLLYSANIIEVLGANATGVTIMRETFDSCTALTSVALFDTSTVSTMNYTFNNCTSLTSVPLFDTSNVTDMSIMFDSCSSLTTVPLFDTSNVTTMAQMFNNCTSLTTVLLFDTSNVTDMTGMFANCSNVTGGALALYQQASSQANPPTNHLITFRNCGSNTTTGAAELAQIPSDWK
jgi:surface protein